ncbi:hypothetical protein HDU98_002983 [Podochytrium sp. JEL0797]|nr:hypothetical protein HDU98_002983 [Podochytrium sp. JEL0797]
MEDPSHKEKKSIFYTFMWATLVTWRNQFKLKVGDEKDGPASSVTTVGTTAAGKRTRPSKDEKKVTKTGTAMKKQKKHLIPKPNTKNLLTQSIIQHLIHPKGPEPKHLLTPHPMYKLHKSLMTKPNNQHLLQLKLQTQSLMTKFNNQHLLQPKLQTQSLMTRDGPSSRPTQAVPEYFYLGQ